MIKKFTEYNETIGFKIPGTSDDVTGTPVRKKLGFKPSWITDEVQDEETDYEDIPENLYNRRAYTVNDMISVLKWIKEGSDVATTNKIDFLAEELGLTELSELSFKPKWEKDKPATGINRIDTPTLSNLDNIDEDEY